MNIPFPVIYPPMIAPDWFRADEPCDDDAELTKLEQANQEWLNSIANKYMKHTPVEKPNPGPTEEAGSDDDATDDVEESEESRDGDEEDVPMTESPPLNNDDGSDSHEDTTEAADLEVEATLWPFVGQSE